MLYTNVGLDDRFASESTSVDFASAPFFRFSMVLPKTVKTRCKFKDCVLFWASW